LDDFVMEKDLLKMIFILMKMKIKSADNNFVLNLILSQASAFNV